METRETEFGTFDRPCDDYDEGQIRDGKPVEPNRNCAYCGFEKTWHLGFSTGQRTPELGGGR